MVLPRDLQHLLLVLLRDNLLPADCLLQGVILDYIALIEIKFCQKLQEVDVCVIKDRFHPVEPSSLAVVGGFGA